MYYAALREHSRQVALALESTVIAALETYAITTVNDSLSNDLKAAWDAFAQKTAALPTAARAAFIFRRVSDHIDEYHRKQFVAAAKKAIGLDISKTLGRGGVNLAVRQAVRDNVKLIKSIDKSYKRRAQRIIEQTLFEGGDVASLKKELYNLGGFSDHYRGTEIRRARIIARDQTQKLTAAIDRARQDDAGITHYYWDAVIDERTDEDHKANDGKRFAWARPPKAGHPGDRPQCRCVARPDYSTMKEARQAA